MKSSKHLAFIASGGRTGTAFLGRFISEIVRDAFSVHEPDILAGIDSGTWQKIRTFGLYHMTLGRLLGRTGLRPLSENLISGRLSPAEAAERLASQRGPYYAKVPASLVVESYYQWYGLLPAIPLAFPMYRVIGIVRDPRTWIRSWMAEGGHHGDRDRVGRLGLRRLDPAMTGEQSVATRWDRMDPFEKLCWEWRTVNRLILEGVRSDPNVRVFRFEDLFSAESPRAFRELLSFLCRFGDRTFEYEFDPQLLDTRVNARRRKMLGDWRDWPDRRVAAVHEYCGPLMSELGYGLEQEWTKRVKRATRSSP